MNCATTLGHSKEKNPGKQKLAFDDQEAIVAFFPRQDNNNMFEDIEKQKRGTFILSVVATSFMGFRNVFVVVLLWLLCFC